MNIITLTDSYKVTHWPQYPPGTQYVYSYLESRGGKWPETLFFGLQYILKKYMEGPVVDLERILQAEKLYGMHLGSEKLFNMPGWIHLLNDHKGRLPLRIRAVPEGTIVPTHNVLVTAENTCPKCYWVTNYLETLMVQVWFPMAVATLSYEIYRLILKYLKDTGDPSLINFKLHDFGFRGVSSVESAGIGGAAHLVNFMGTDTVRGLEVLAEYYAEQCAGFSIPASEHSTITSWGKAREVDAFRNMLDKYPSGLVACVSDSFDIYHACSNLWGGELKDRVLERDGTLVVRPDSGDPPADVVLKVLDTLGKAFGYTYNDKGFKVLHPKVRVIQGDGVNYDSISDILSRMKSWGWSADNVAFGMGGALLQKLNRDTQKVAFKCSYVSGAHGHGFWERDVYKQPITDPGKDSKKGRLVLVKKNGTFYTQPASLSTGEEDQLVDVFVDGTVTRHYTLSEIRNRVKG